MITQSVVVHRSSGSLPAKVMKGGAVAAIVAGAFRIASDIVDFIAVPPGGGAKALLTDAYMVSSVLDLAFSLLLVWALPGLFEHADEARGERSGGRLLLIGFGLAMFGAVMAAGNSWATTFVAPIAANEAPNLSFVATTGRAPGLLQLAVMLTYVPFSIGLMMLAGSVFRSRAYPLAAGAPGRCPSVQHVSPAGFWKRLGGSPAVSAWGGFRCSWVSHCSLQVIDK